MIDSLRFDVYECDAWQMSKYTQTTKDIYLKCILTYKSNKFSSSKNNLVEENLDW